MVQARIVIATTTPRALVTLAGDALGDAYIRRALRFRYGPQTIKLDWALDAPIPWSSEDTRGAGTVHVGGDGRRAARRRARGRDGPPPRASVPALRPAVDRRPDARARRQAHRVGVHAHAARRRLGARARGFADTIERQIERFAPGFRDRILARHVMAPDDLERRNANLVGGDVGGGSYALDQLIFRPVPALNPYATPVRGLYIGSAVGVPRRRRARRPGPCRRARRPARRAAAAPMIAPATILPG